MLRQCLTKSPRGMFRNVPISKSSQLSYSFIAVAPRLRGPITAFSQRSISSCLPRPRGIMPDTESPAKESSEPEPTSSFGVVDISESQYHEIADEFLDRVLLQFEHLQDTREDLDIEYSSGVMTITHAEKGTYVINKQPPNKQIWLSSPLSGPKRYDWCVLGESQTEKEGTGTGDWIYGRDGSSLSDLILEELDVDIATPTTN